MFEVATIRAGRITLRPLVLTDSDFIFQLFNQEDVIQFIGNKNITDQVSACDYLINGPLNQYQKYGLGLLAMTIREDSKEQVIGLCGLLQREELEFPDLGYALLKHYYRKGYTFEACQAVIGNYREQLVKNNVSSAEILAITSLDNIASKGLLSRLGFIYQGEKVVNKQSSSLFSYQLNKSL